LIHSRLNKIDFTELRPSCAFASLPKWPPRQRGSRKRADKLSSGERLMLILVH
jgi:hypothetical protein